MIQIPVQPNSFALIDDEDFERLSAFKWYLSNGYAVSKKLKKMHRIILNTPKGKMTDHIDHNPLNNQKNNLRIVNQSENIHNQRKRRNTKNNFKGVFYVQRLHLYQSRCRIYKKDYFLGYFKSEIAAAYAYNKKAIELSGCALLNKLPYEKEVLERMLVEDRVTIKRAEKQSKQKAVYWHSFNKKWGVTIKRKHYGAFRHEADAIKRAKQVLVTLQP